MYSSAGSEMAERPPDVKTCTSTVPGFAEAGTRTRISLDETGRIADFGATLLPKSTYSGEAFRFWP